MKKEAIKEEIQTILEITAIQAFLVLGLIAVINLHNII